MYITCASTSADVAIQFITTSSSIHAWIRGTLIQLYLTQISIETGISAIAIKPTDDICALTKIVARFGRTISFNAKVNDCDQWTVKYSYALS